MRHGSLFSGIGGFDLAAEWMGWTNVFHCEWNDFGQRVLKHHFPKSKSYGDITQTDFTIHRGDIDILTGGFPCQPYSNAGKRLGKDDERHLWPEMLRVIRETSPRYVVGENVRGLTNWNGGLVFDEVQADLEAIGYEVLPFLLPACAVGAPHRRDRVWFIAYRNDGSRQEYELCTGRHLFEKRTAASWTASNTDSLRLNEREREHEEHAGQGRLDALDDVEQNDGERYAADTDDKRLQRRSNPTRNDSQRWEESDRHFEEYAVGSGRTLHTESWKNFPTQSPVCSGDDGLPAELDGITFSKWRVESVKAYGNAIVPQVALEIFKAIQKMETIKNQ
jgi:DNA (cytosine-5)-methyltransferase 1